MRYVRADNINVHKRERVLHKQISLIDYHSRIFVFLKKLSYDQVLKQHAFWQFAADPFNFDPLIKSCISGKLQEMEEK
jgi:hypothetical protein